MTLYNNIINIINKKNSHHLTHVYPTILTDELRFHVFHSLRRELDFDLDIEEFTDGSYEFMLPSFAFLGLGLVVLADVAMDGNQLCQVKCITCRKIVVLGSLKDTMSKMVPTLH